MDLALAPILLKLLMQGDHYVLVVVMLVLAGAWKWWLGVQAHVCRLLGRLMGVMEKIAEAGLHLHVNHHQDLAGGDNDVDGLEDSSPLS